MMCEKHVPDGQTVRMEYFYPSIALGIPVDIRLISNVTVMALTAFWSKKVHETY